MINYFINSWFITYIFTVDHMFVSPTFLLWYLCVCVCVCVREIERERKRESAGECFWGWGNELIALKDRKLNLLWMTNGIEAAHQFLFFQRERERKRHTHRETERENERFTTTTLSRQFCFRDSMPRVTRCWINKWLSLKKNLMESTLDKVCK